MSRETHRVPASTIKDWMDGWKWDLTVDEILNFEPEEKPVEEAKAQAPELVVDVAPVPSVPPAQIDSPLEDTGETLQDSAILKPGERSPFL
jgi:hypothetical protein